METKSNGIRKFTEIFISLYYVFPKDRRIKIEMKIAIKCQRKDTEENPQKNEWNKK